MAESVGERYGQQPSSKQFDWYRVRCVVASRVSNMLTSCSHTETLGDYYFILAANEMVRMGAVSC